MKIILIQDMPSLGQKGEIKEVAAGYARNYLIPRGLAVEATPGELRTLQANKAAVARKNAKELKAAREIAEKISGKSFTVQVKAGEGGRLFGSVTSADLAAVMEKSGFSIDKKKIDLAEPIKELGEFPVQVKLHPEVHVPVSVIVQPEE